MTDPMEQAMLGNPDPSMSDVERDIVGKLKAGWTVAGLAKLHGVTVGGIEDVIRRALP